MRSNGTFRSRKLSNNSLPLRNALNRRLLLVTRLLWTIISYEIRNPAIFLEGIQVS